MEDQAELIRQQMQEKRAELSEKIQTLGESLGEMLPSTTAVTDTVESVRETAEVVAEDVEETVQTIRDALDLPRHVREHPWLAVGGAVVVGYLAHSYLTSRPGASRALQNLFSRQFQGLEEYASRAAWDVIGGLAAGAAASQSSSLLQSLLQQFLHGPAGAGAKTHRRQTSNGTHDPAPTVSRTSATADIR